MTVRRLTAVDMYGGHGSVRRARAVVLGFVVSTVGMVGLGLVLLAVPHRAGTLVVGLWALGVGLNYAVLAAYGLVLSRPGALDRELAGADVGREARRYAVRRLWVLLPLALVAAAAWDMVVRRS